MPKVLESAVRCALRAHGGQIDKSGSPYLDHLARVAARVALGGERLTAVAWLHDCVEDGLIDLLDLREEGFPAEVIEAVDAISRRRGDDDASYYRRVLRSPLARQVKRADVADNCDERRLALLDDESRQRLRAKYTAARSTLGPACHVTPADFAAYGATDLAWLDTWADHPIAIYESHAMEISTTAISMALGACRDEAAVTPLVVGCLHNGCRMAGFRHRVKSPGAIAQRLERTRHELDFLEPPKDLVRYTVVAPEESLWEEAEAFCAELAARLRPIRARHFFVDGNPYMGIHTWWTAPSGNFVEIQIHSDTSYRIKEETHDLYEIYRDPTRNYAERLDAFRRRRSAWPASAWAGKIPCTLGGMPLQARAFLTPADVDGQFHVRSVVADREELSTEDLGR